MPLSLISSKNLKTLNQLWRLALPVMFTNLLQSLVGVIDVFMVGRLGPIAIAAVGMGNIIRLLVLVLVLSVSAGAMSLIAQAKGARDPNRMSIVTRQALSSGFLLSLILLAGGYLLARPLLTLANSGGDLEAVELGTIYLQTIFLGAPFLILNVVINRLMQGAGDTITPLILTGMLNFLNVGLNYLFMFGAGPIQAYGVQGAALGTIIARAVGLLIAICVIYSGRNVVKVRAGTYWPDWQMFTDILTIGVPSGIQGVFRNSSRLLVVSIVTSTAVGTYGAAAISIGLQVESLAFMPVLGVNVAATSLVGQSLGSWQTTNARERGNIAILFGVVVLIFLATPMVIFAPAIIRFFDPSAHPVLLEAGVSYMRINTAVLPIAAVPMVANGAMRGAGDSLPGMISTIVNRAVLSVSLAWLFAFPLGLGANGVWYALAIGIVFDAVFMGIRWHSGRWINIALHKTELYRQHLHHLPDKIQQQFLSEVRTPLMAQPQTIEEVTDKNVTYHLMSHDIQFVFENGRYAQRPLLTLTHD